MEAQLVAVVICRAYDIIDDEERGNGPVLAGFCEVAFHLLFQTRMSASNCDVLLCLRFLILETMPFVIVTFHKNKAIASTRLHEPTV